MLRPAYGRWTAVDNGSLNGMFVRGRRVPEVEVTDATVVNLGNPEGPELRFELGSQQGPTGRLPQPQPR